MSRCLLSLRLVLLVALGASFLLPGATAQRPGKGSSSKVQKKTYHFKEAKKDMEYALFVPSKYDKEKKSPLIVALHGLGSTPQGIMRYKGLVDLAEKHGYIVAAPMGYNPRGWYGALGKGKGLGGRGGAGKGKGKEKDVPENLGELSEKDVMNVLEIVRKDYSIDPNRIYLMGHSMGGGGTIHLATKHPDLWAALAPLAPALFKAPSELKKIKHLPIILVQGDKDKLCPVGTARKWADQMKKLEMKYEYVEIAGGDHVTVAWENLPKVFAFFNKHKREKKDK